MMEPVTIFWFRRDLRLNDNSGLYYALKERGNVLPLFIFDTEILEKLTDKTDRRVSFIFDHLLNLKEKLEQNGSSLLIRYGKPADVIGNLADSFEISAIYTNYDYEPYAKRRDEEIRTLLKLKGIDFRTFKDQVIFEKNEVTKDDGKPYTIYTPYMKQWRSVFSGKHLENQPSEHLLDQCLKMEPANDFDYKTTGFSYVKPDYPSSAPDVDLISNYDKTRDIPSLNGTSRLGVHLRFGTISIRRLAEIAFEHNEVFLNELIWREFYMMILWHFPQVVDKAFKPRYDNIRWINDEKLFKAWCEGRTGYPIVDAGMRQLNETGYMHNRVRMITASFLTKHLLTDWRWGEAYFAEKLLDYELASNNGGWQWAAGSGCDAAPYFRVFNPELQTKKFDPELEYIRKWVPELDSSTYPKPIVEHKAARERALKAYKTALNAV
jgi:deoxyribodipyrimidine photo-lyase